MLLICNIVLILLNSRVSSLPVETRCFTDGVLVDSKQMDHGIAEICIKDDISMIKTTSKQISNTTTHVNSITRKMMIQNYDDCNPIEVSNGPIMIFKPNKELVLVPHTYACRVDCTISLDEEEANIVLHSDKLNHFEVMGTTTANKWFQGSTSYSLEHTCEHIQVTCGSNSLSFHACFKYHMACIRLMNRSYMPAFMIQSICQNKELILMGLLVLIIFGILYVMTLTYICYILVPIFYPFTYIWGLLYNRSCKKCYYCGLAYHPFTKCGKNCVCGCMFENSERMKAHRENGMCKGYKSLRAARILCKNRGSSLILACILSFLLLSFIQPLEAVKLQYNNEIIELDSVTEQFNSLTDQLDIAQVMPYAFLAICFVAMILICIIISFRTKLELLIFERMMHYCAECNMIHSRKGLRFFFNGEFTSKCNSCACGVDYNDELKDNNDYMIVMDHQLNERCYIPGKYKAVRKLESVTTGTIMIILILLMLIAGSYADNCVDIKNSKTVSQPVTCSVWYKLTGSCTGSSNIKETFSKLKLAQEDIDSLKPYNREVMQMLKESEEAVSQLKSYLLEEAAAKLHCTELSDFNTKTGRFNKKLITLMQTKQHEMEICSANTEQKFCKCVKEGLECTSEDLTSAINYYKSHNEAFKKDFKRVVTALIDTYPGLFARELALSLKTGNLSKAKDIATSFKDKFGNADVAKILINYIIKITANTDLVKVNLELAVPKINKYSVDWSAKGIFENMEDGQAAKKECLNKALFRCASPITMRFKFVLSCNGENNKFYLFPEQGVAGKRGDTNTLCVGDSYCKLDFVPIKTSEKDTWNSLICSQTTDGFNFSNTLPISKCRKVSTQTCTFDGQNKTFMECSNGFFYEYTNIVHQAPGDDIGIYCFDKACRGVVYPHHVDTLVGCKPHVVNMKSRRLKEIVYEDIEQLKHSIQEVIKTDLVEHKYILTKDLPKMSPSFRPLSIQGTETDSGVENAYIETNLIVRAGVSTGITLKAKDGTTLFDLVIFVKSAHYESTADYIYTTGPTVGINAQHDEQCTGTCPKDLKKLGWLSFYKEHTSNWGCEEFGCLAINEGCVFGHCRDIIKPDLRVYKRQIEEIPKITICITMPDMSYCHEITSFNPIISETMEIQFLSNEAGRLPKVFGFKSNKVMTGMINDLGTFSRMCGSVQSVGNNVNGAGTARFDYICHAARRKEIKITRCFDNFYESCLNLNTERDMVFDDKSSKILYLNRLMGEIRLKLKLGDIRYKTFEEKPSFDLKGSCVGCIDCIKGMDCEITILATTDAVCPIISNCVPFHNNIRIEANTQKYGLKMKCSSEVVKIKICEQEVEIMPTIIKKQEVIEVGNSDQTYFVKEKDIRCATWLCKVSDQGISAVFSPFFSIFGTYGKIVFYSLLGLLLLFIAGYILMPVFGRIADMLKSHEIEYQRETFGRKKHTR